MTRWLIPFGLLLWIGLTLVLSELRWFSRRPLEDRLRPYVPGGWERPARGGVLSVDSFREVVAPLASSLGGTLSRVFGVHEDLATRLARIHSPLDATALRVRQLTWAAASFALAGTCPTERAADLPAAVRAARAAARPGDTVLLSPACASLDMFRDYVHRGEVYAAAVRSLA